MVTEGAERGDKVRVVLVEFIVLGNVHQEVAFHVLVLRGPNLFSTFKDDLVLVRVMVGSGARRGSKKMREELGFWEDRKWKDAARRSGRGRRRDDSDGGSDDGRREILDWDVGERNTLNDFLKALMDICVLWLGVRVVKLRTREVVLLSGDVGEYFEEIGWGGDEDRQGGSDGDDGRRVDDKWGKEGRWTDGRVRKNRDSERGGRVAVGTWIVPSVVGAVEEVLNNLVGGGDIYLVAVVNL